MRLYDDRGGLLVPFNEWTQEQLSDYAQQDEGQSCGPNPRLGVEDFTWQFHPRFPLDQLHGSQQVDTPETWTKWLQDEIDHFRYGPEDGAKYYGEMEEWWKLAVHQKDLCDEPIIAAEDHDGRIYVWGGYHRTAITHKLQVPYIPAVIGRLK